MAADPETPPHRQRQTPPAPSAAPDTASFGYREVPRGEKAALVRGVFDSVAGRYDLMNDLMSMGVHRLWKDAFVAMLAPQPGLRLLDVAGGTGDVAFRVAEKLRGPAGMDGRITVLDLTESMLRVGRDRGLDRGLVQGLDWVCADAMALPLPPRCQDAYTIAFGLRNVTDIEAALAEAHRVLRPGGRFLCLEFSRVVLPLLDRAYDVYSFEVLPRLGALVAGDRESYQYLVESIRRFPSQAELAEKLAAAGFARPTWRNLSGGIAAIHSAWRI